MTDADHTLAAAYALDALEDEDRAAFESHLMTCDACATDVREMRATTTRLAVAESVEPPAQLRDQVLAAARRTPQDGAETTVVELRSRRSLSVANRWGIGVAAAAVLVAAVFGVSTYQANQRADEATQAASQMTAILTDPASQRTTMHVTGGGNATLFVSPSSHHAVLATTGVPSLSADQAYQLWAMDDGTATSIGLYDVDAAGDGTRLVEFPESADTFGMTVEPKSGSPEPTTAPVLLIPLSV